MIKFLFTTLLISIFSLTPVDSSLDISDWTFIKEEKGAKLYNRTIEGFDNKEIKVILDLNVDLNKTKEFLFSGDNIQRWMSGCNMSESKSSMENEIEYYSVFDAPWPVTDRDDYGKMSLETSSDSELKISFKSVPDGTPKVSSMVRVPFSKGFIHIKTLDDGQKELTYQMLVDRGGKLPGYLKDYLEETSPMSTVHNLKKILETL